jgi:hypothetical protein
LRTTHCGAWSKIKIIRPPGSHIQADITKIPGVPGKIKNPRTRPFRFPTDGKGVLFTDGDRVYTSQELSDALCQTGTIFFDPDFDQ